MALAYTAPTWTDGSGEGISASNLQAISNCIEGLVQGTDKAIHSFTISGSIITITFADGTIETSEATGLKGIAQIEKTGTSGYVDTYTITYTDGTTSTFEITNGAVPSITANATADALSSDTPTVTVTKAGTDAAPVFSFAFSGLKGAQGIPGPQGPAGTGDMDTADYDPDDTVADAGGIVDYVAAEVSGKADAECVESSFFEVSTSNWVQDTTSQSGSTLYKKTISLTNVYKDVPDVSIGASSGLPTTAQQTAYDLLKYVTVDSAVPCLYLYATAVPSDTFYINVEGVD